LRVGRRPTTTLKNQQGAENAKTQCFLGFTRVRRPSIEGDPRRSGPFFTASEAKDEFKETFPEFVGGSVWMTKVTSPLPEISPEELLRLADREEYRLFWGKTLQEVEETPWQDIWTNMKLSLRKSCGKKMGVFGTIEERSTIRAF
jgi:hypothetical protein